VGDHLAAGAERVKQRTNVVLFPLCFGIGLREHSFGWAFLIGCPVFAPHEVANSPLPGAADALH